MKLYYMPPSPPARSVLMTMRCLGLDVELVYVDLLKGEHKNPGFLKLSPIGQVPVLDDDGFVLNESRAIMAYLVNSKKPGSSFYPQDPHKRAVIDARLYFDATRVFALIFEAMSTIIWKGVKEVSPEIREKMKQSLTLLEGFLKETAYFAGDEPTLADISILSNIIYMKNMFGSIGNFPNIEAWFKRCATLPGYDENLKLASTILEIFEKIELKLAPLE